VRKVRLAAAVAFGILFIGASAPLVARACSVATHLSVTGTSGTRGSQALVFGQAFDFSPVSVYWGSVGGPLLATVPVTAASGMSFSRVPITIPLDATPKAYYIVATDGAGSVSTPFTVTAGPPPAPSLPPTPAASQDPVPQSNGSTSPVSPPAAAPISTRG
jgi:hypothetical protein